MPRKNTKFGLLFAGLIAATPLLAQQASQNPAPMERSLRPLPKPAKLAAASDVKADLIAEDVAPLSAAEAQAPSLQRSETEPSQNEDAAVVPETKRAEVVPADVPPVEVVPVEVVPLDIKPAQTAPADIKPADIKPADIKPAEPIPVEPTPVEVKPDEIRPSETKSDGPKSAVMPSEIVKLSHEPVASWIDTSDVTRANFNELRTAAILRTVDEPGYESWLSYARIMLGGAFFKETIAGLENAVASGLPDSGADHAHAQLIRTALLSIGEHIPASVEQRLGAPVLGDDFYAALLRARNAAQTDAEIIRLAATGLAWQSGQVVEHTTPILFEKARQLKDADLAGRLLGAAEKSSEIEKASIYPLLKGDLAILRAKPAEAFKLYASALTQRDRNGALARVRLADMGLAQKDQISLEAVRDLLVEGVDQWRGDDVSLEMLTRLAGVSESLRDPPLALRTMARIKAEYPQHPLAALALDRIDLIFRFYASQLEKGDVPLEQYIQVMRELQGNMSGYSGWVKARSALAVSLEANGLHHAASAEYASIIQDIKAGRTPSDRFQNERLLREQVRLMISAGDRAGARSALLDDAQSTFSNIELRALAFSVLTTDDYAKTVKSMNLSTISGPDALELGRLAFASGDRAGALEAWNRYLDAGGRLHNADLVRYTDAKSGLSMKGSETSKTPATSAGDVFVDAMSTALSTEMPGLERLNLETARAIVDAATTASEAAMKRDAPEKSAKKQNTED